jgi:hypothetical protein
MAFPPNFTNVWDVTFPPDTQLANLLGQDLRNIRTDVMQRLSLLSGTLANRPTPETVNATWGGAGFGLLYFSTDTSQVFQWLGATWADISSQILGIASGGTQGNPRIVATVNVVNSALAIAPTTLYAVPAIGAGIYRATNHLLLTQAGTGGSIFPQLIWNNGFSTSTQNGPAINTVNLSFETDMVGVTNLATSVTFYSIANQNIQYAVSFNGVTGTPKFTLSTRLEYLG